MGLWCNSNSKKHWREFKPSSKKRLSPPQKINLLQVGFFWLSDAMGPIMVAMNIIWVPVIIFVGVTIPTIPSYYSNYYCIYS